MRVLIFPHDLDMGGSQMNAIELAATLRDQGHECVIFGHRGILCEKIDALGLEFIEAPRPSHRPTPSIVGALNRLAREREFDIIHGYEWPPGLEVFLATRRSQTRAVCTVMSMAVAPFLPKEMPLIVGTRQIAAHELSIGRLHVNVLEPPVDLRHNQPPSGDTLSQFKRKWQLDGRPLVVCVSRLAHELKSEGILAAIHVAGSQASTHPFQLLIVGDGPAREEIAAAARRANQQAGSNTVVMTGELLDPRPAYALADVSLGMGGSALRALAFGTPLIVQGEKGFFRTLTPESFATFQWQGWYGVGEDPKSGPATLIDELTPLLSDPALLASLGDHAREVAQLFSLETAAHEQVRIYQRVLDTAPAAPVSALLDGTMSTLGFASYFVRQQVGRLLRRNAQDDFNVQPVAAAAAVKTPEPGLADSEGPIVYLPGVRWDTLAGTDRNLVTALSRERQVIWVETHSAYRTLFSGNSLPRVTYPSANVIRLRVNAPPGLSRPLIRGVTNWLVAQQVRNYIDDNHITPSAIVAATSEPLLPPLRDIPGIRIYFATDDFTAGADLFKLPTRYLAKSRERNLKAADLVLAVSPDLARELQRGPLAPIWFPNGADIERYDEIDQTAISPKIALPQPTVGVVGQFNERIDFHYLHAIRQSALSLLLVGPQFFSSSDTAAKFQELVSQPNVQWIDRVPPEDLPAYMCAISVGLTPYSDSMFNRRSYPLKTLEYLSAGIPVVSTSVPPLNGFDRRFVVSADSPEKFAQAARRLLEEKPDRAEIRASIQGHSWGDRAGQLVHYIEAAHKRRFTSIERKPHA